MIYFRRILATIIGLMFLTVFFVSLSVWQVNGTVRDTSFFQKHMSEAQLFDDIYPIIFSELVRDNTTDDNIAGFDLPHVVTNVSAIADIVLPPKWIEQQLTHIINEVHPYLMGLEDSFEVKIETSDRLVLMAETIQKPEHQEILYTVVIQDLLTPLIVDSIRDIYDIEVASIEVKDAIEKSVAREWLFSQAAIVIQQIIEKAGIHGEEDLFIVDIKEPVYSSLIGSEAPMKILLKDIGFYERAIETLIPFIVDELTVLDNSDAGYAPSDVSVIKIKLNDNVTAEFTSEEIQRFLRIELIDEFRGLEQMEQFIDPIILYFVGETDSFSSELDLSALSTPFRDFVASAFVATFELKYAELPECDPKTAILFAQSETTTEIPDCRVTGLSIEQIQIAAGLPQFPPLTRRQIEQACKCSIESILGGVNPAQILTAIGLGGGISANSYENIFPETLLFTNVDVIDMFDQNSEQMIDKVRNFVQNGFIVRKEDILFGSKPLSELLNLQYISEGIIIGESDLKVWLGGNSGDQGIDDQGTDALESSRKQVHGILSTLERIRYPLMLLSALLLVIVSVLGGRGWRGRFQWFGAWGLVVAGLVLTLTGPIYHYAIAPSIVNGRLIGVNVLGTGGDGALYTLVITKMLDLLESMISTMLLPIFVVGVLVGIGSMLPLVFARFYPRH